MGLPPLAQVRDVTNRLPSTISVEPIRVTALLADASAAVRRFTKQTFTATQSTANIRPVGSRLRLPNQPVISVDDVRVWLQRDGDPAPFPAWFWDGSNEIWLLTSGNYVINMPEEMTDTLAWQTPMFAVTYTHGYTEIPEDVVAVVCSVVTRLITAPSMGGVVSENVGDYGYRLSDIAVQGPMALTSAEKSILAAYQPAPMSSLELRGG